MKSEANGIISTVNVTKVLTGFYIAGDFEKTARGKKLLHNLTLNSSKIVPVTFELLTKPQA